MKLGEMVSRTRMYLDDREGDRWDRQTLVALLNDAQRAIEALVTDADEGFFRAIAEFSVVATPNDTLEFDLPADFEKSLHVERKVSGAPPWPASDLTFVDRHNIESRLARSIYVSGPKYYIQGTKIGVVEPDEAYTLRLYYAKRLPELDQDTDESEIPETFHKMLCMHAARLALISIGESPSLWDDEYNREYDRLIKYLDGRHKAAPRRVRYIEP